MAGKWTWKEDKCYMRLSVRLLLPKDADVEVDPKQTKLALISGLKSVFGTISVARHAFDVLIQEKIAKGVYSCVLRLDSRTLSTLWGAFTMCTMLDKYPCKFQVEQVSSSLMELASQRYLD
ncbi:hypothetical protein THRCLA_22213 [Thraustotheca clavata]|uniref:Uncharacterized protein n=1 Tax=Thraustotheca clavata TaxID=74557 RepID=A0A1V9ZA51_9STRA|nr:hypothetical protein THRCLA_22213 [Thraustotheca clavata]